MRKHDVSPYTTPGWDLKERLDSPLITPIGILWALLIQFFLCAWPHREGEVMKRGETSSPPPSNPFADCPLAENSVPQLQGTLSVLRL